MAGQNDLVARFSKADEFGQLALASVTEDTHELNMDYLMVRIK